MEACADILVVGRPGYMRTALAGLLDTEPNRRRVICAGSVAAPGIHVSYAAVIVLCEGYPDGEIRAFVRQAKEWQLSRRCLVLADGQVRQQLARAEGADCVLPTGLPARDLIAAVERLLDDGG